MKRGVSFSWFLAHCSARGERASKHSWLISELILETHVKEENLQRKQLSTTPADGFDVLTLVLFLRNVTDERLL